MKGKRTAERVTEFNNGSLEILIAFARGYSVVGVVVAVGLLSIRAWYPAAVEGATALLAGWWSWWYMGNEEWGRRDPHPTCGRPGPGGSRCTVKITPYNRAHVGIHRDENASGRVVWQNQEA